jgi:hypothetical protein
MDIPGPGDQHRDEEDAVPHQPRRPLVVPEGWVVVPVSSSGTPDVLRSGGITFIAQEWAVRGNDVTANLVVTNSLLNGLTFRDWQVGTEELLARTLPDYRVIDLERVNQRDGQATAGRRIAHHLAADGHALTLDQWFVANNRGVGYTLSFTLPTRRYANLVDLVHACALTWTALRAASGRHSSRPDEPAL